MFVYLFIYYLKTRVTETVRSKETDHPSPGLLCKWQSFTAFLGTRLAAEHLEFELVLYGMLALQTAT